jgi:hypothetical protein
MNNYSIEVYALNINEKEKENWVVGEILNNYALFHKITHMFQKLRLTL